MKKIKRFWLMEKNVLFRSYVILIYTLITVDDVVRSTYIEQGIYIKNYTGLCFVISIILAFIISLVDYALRKKIIEGICFQVIEEYSIKEQYERFLAIKKCIERFKYQNRCNLKRNVYVIEAAIERDQTYSIVFPLMITILTTLFIEKEIIPITSPIAMIMITLLVLVVLDIIFIIPRNAFIKKVIECIKKEHGLQ